MAKKDWASDEDQEVAKLVAEYERMKKENRSIYMDGDQLAEIANSYATNQMFDEAQEVISYGLGIHPGDTNLMLQQAYLYLDINKNDKARMVAELITDTSDSDVILLKAEFALREGNPDNAEQLLATLSEEDKNDCDTIVGVCYLYLGMGFPDLAIEWLGKGMEKFCEDEEFLGAAADCHAAVGKNEQAVFFYNKAIDKNPYGAKYWVGIAKCYFSDEEFEKALEAVDFAIAADESYSEAYVIRAHCMVQLGNSAEAIAMYRKALEDKALPSEFGNLFSGLALMEEEKWEEAADYFEKGVKVLLENKEENDMLLADLYIKLGMCYVKTGKFAEAHNYIRLSIAIDPNNCETYITEGCILIEEGNTEEGIRVWDKALQCDTSVETLEIIAEHSLRYELLSYAIFCFEQIKMVEPDYPDIDRQLAILYLGTGDQDNFKRYNELSGNQINLESILQDLDSLNAENPEAQDSVDQFRQFIIDRMSPNTDTENKNENQN